MIYRDWIYQDILRISEIEKECFGGEAWSFQMFADSFSLDNFLGVVAEEGGEVVGYGCLSVRGDDADLDNIAVVEPFRQSGVGKNILKRLVQKAKEKKLQKLFLEVRVTNAPAQILYLKNGFKGLYVRSRYYPDGEDAIVMVKELSKK